MNQVPPQLQLQESPAMGERRARWGYGYQDKIATERILNLLRENLRAGAIIFEGVRLADLDAGRVDDFVLVWRNKVEGNSIKWSREAAPFNWGELIGANGLLKELADGYQRLKNRWPGKDVSVRLQSNRPPSLEKNHAQLISTFSVADFLKDHWSIGPTIHDSDEIAEVWSKISMHVGLSGSDFSNFIKSCNFSLGYPDPPGSASDSQDWHHYKKQFDDLHKAIATWLTDNPQSDFIDQSYLLSAIGFRKYRSDLIQRFPLPKIPYSKNKDSAAEIKHLIDNTNGGYIAVVGPAGIGKSTLVQDVLSDNHYPYFIPYYAYLPETDGNRDRCEALTFFQDVIGRLDKFFQHRYSIGISDIAQGREALRKHMSKANEQYVLQGYKTILLIDGLDHVSREINLQNALLHELPSPDEIPDGFLIVLSSQPQALIPGVIAAQVGNAVGPQSDRRIVVSGLTRHDVHKILEEIGKVTTSAERDALHSASLGNPLVLTYLLNQFLRTPVTTVNEAIISAGNYGGDIDDYYRLILTVHLQDAQTRYLLGLLCRAAPTIPVVWLQGWAEHILIENIYDRILAPFVQVEEGNLIFIHNSLIAFLKSETRSRLPGIDSIIDDQNYYSNLADRCDNLPCIDPLGRAKVFYLLHANRDDDLLAVLSSSWLRQATESFLPYALIRPLLLSGLESAWKLGDLGQLLRLILLDCELGQRTSRTAPEDLAENLLRLDMPDLAVSQIRANGRLLVEDKIALKFALRLWLYADDHNQVEQKNIARMLYLQSKPISFFYQSDPIDIYRYNESYSLLQAWSDVAPLFEDCDSIIAQIKNLHFQTNEYGEKVDDAELKAGLIYQALITVIGTGLDINNIERLLDEIEGLGSCTLRFAALLNLAKQNPQSITFGTLETAYRDSERDDDIDLAYANFLYYQGYYKEAKEIVSRLSHIRFDGIRNSHSFGYSDISYTVTLRSLQEFLGLPEGTLPGVKRDSEEALARVERTARQLGVLLATVKMGKSIPDLNNLIRSLLLFHNQAVVLPDFGGRNSYVVNQSKKGIYKQIVRFSAAVGKKGLESLRDVLLDLLNGPVGSQFASHHRRYFAEVLFHHGVLSKEQATDLGLSSTLDANDDDPMQRQEACLEIAHLLHSIGEESTSSVWFKRAGEVTAGAGSHKDYHMLHLAGWLSHSIGSSLNPNKLSVLDKFARSVEVAGGDGTSDAAAHELQLIIQAEPNRASRFAIELVDRGILNVSQTLEALIVGSAKAGSSSGLLVSLYNELLSLISPKETSEAAVEIIRRFPVNERVAVAKDIMSYIRTNALPRHRIDIARAIQDSLRQDGLGEHVLTQGLKPGEDDSSKKNALYKSPSGEMETIDQVAARLSTNDNQSEWNPNPGENNEFDWWKAIKKVKIENEAHLNALLTTFPPDHYRDVDLLSWKSERLLEIGEHEAVRLLAEQAIENAKEASWHHWYDGAQKMVAYGALKRINKQESITLARIQFGKDLVTGKLNNYFLISDIPEIIDFLELEWPAEDVCLAIDDYLDNVLAANKEVQHYVSLTNAREEGSLDKALCEFIIHLLAFPVVDIGIYSRNALARYIITDGIGLVDLINNGHFGDPVQLEHVLISLHVGSYSNTVAINKLQDFILSLNKHESIAVRGIARRISEEHGWQWVEINNQAKQPVILLSESMEGPSDYDDARMLIGGNIATALLLYPEIFINLEKAGLDSDELKSEFYRFYQEIEKEYGWADEKLFNSWMKMVLARHWLHPRAIIGREAAVRVLGRRSLSGQAPPGAETSYDYIYPIYDPVLELCKAEERPVEMQAMDWGLGGDQKNIWLRGENADSWNDYPETIDGFFIIGERTILIRPDWEWPREERYRGLVIGPYPSDLARGCLFSKQELTIESYLRGEGQKNKQLITLNLERQLVGPSYRWAAINSPFAQKLGWHSSYDEPFKWVDSSGNLMVKSVYWKDGWIWLEPPRFESLGEGWLVLATQEGIRSIQKASNNIDLHLWVERHYHGENPYEGKWHLSKKFCTVMI